MGIMTILIEANTTIPTKNLKFSLQLQILNQLLNYTFFKELEQWLLITKLSVVLTDGIPPAPRGSSNWFLLILMQWYHQSIGY
jgi:molecular chaperone DnaK (HSP70)